MAKNYKYLPLESLFLKKFGKEIFYYNLKSYNVQYVLKWDFTYRKNSNGTNVKYYLDLAALYWLKKCRFGFLVYFKSGYNFKVWN